MCYQKPRQTGQTRPGASQNSLNLHVVPGRTACLTLLQRGPSIAGQSCRNVIIYAHLSQSGLGCNSLLTSFIGIANQCLCMLHLRSSSIWIPSSQHADPHSVSICSQPVLGSLSSNWTAVVPGRWAKASLDRMSSEDGEKEAEDPSLENSILVIINLGSLSLGHVEDCWHCRLIQVLAMLVLLMFWSFPFMI